MVPGTRRVREAQVARPGLAVVEVAAADDETASAVQESLAARWRQLRLPRRGSAAWPKTKSDRG
ncbi:DUF6207 family protein [Streptomyces sp. NPDC093984]|uniref:DUF6207 family protein n=1 Tax=Streptomyces sp. NPDC093984 TaxID=3366052 RepID=UPI00382930E8